jgi:hypothetical protein
MSPRHRLTPVDADLSERITRLEIARVQLFYVDVDRKKKIDDVIDYFGAGRIGSRRPAPEAARALMPASAASSMSPPVSNSDQTSGPALAESAVHGATGLVRS